MAKTPFALFVSPVEGHLVARYGSSSPTRSNELLGAARDPETGAIRWFTDQVFALSAGEVEAFGREYRRAIASGALEERTEDDYLAFVETPASPAEE